jgi:hypothetical protein
MILDHIKRVLELRMEANSEQPTQDETVTSTEGQIEDVQFEAPAESIVAEAPIEHVNSGN